MLKYSQKPLFYDNKLSRRSRKVLSLAVPVYLVLCIWIFGNFNMLEDPEGVDLDTGGDEEKSYFDFWRVIVRRCTRYNSMPFTVMLVFVAGAFLLATFANRLKDLLELLLVKVFRCKQRAPAYVDEVHFCDRVQDSHKQNEQELFAKQTQGQGHDKKKFPRIDPAHPSVCSEPYDGQVDISLRLVRLQHYAKSTGGRQKKFKIVPSYDFSFHPEYRRLLVSKHA